MSEKNSVGDPQNKASLLLEVKRLMEDPLYYRPHVLFERKDAEEVLFDGNETSIKLPKCSWYMPTMDAPQSSDRQSVMNQATERLMFLRYNYSKRRLSEIRKGILRNGLTEARAIEYMAWHRRSVQYREFLISSNLPLVLAMFKRSGQSPEYFAEMISNAHLAMMRATEKFDVARGFKFSTYCSRGILRAFSRTRLEAKRKKFAEDRNHGLEQVEWKDGLGDEREAYFLEQLTYFMSVNAAGLNEKERLVLKLRFNLGEENDHEFTLEETGKVIGVTQERIRQIQKAALAKIRVIMRSE